MDLGEFYLELGGTILDNLTQLVDLELSDGLVVRYHLSVVSKVDVDGKVLKRRKDLVLHISL